MRGNLWVDLARNPNEFRILVVEEDRFYVVDFATIKADLPHWPDDVIQQWLLKLANRGADTGWPPPERLDGHAWKYILGGRPLSWWKDVSWQLGDNDLEFDALSQASKRIVNQMIDAHINGVANVYSTMADSKTRFESASRYIAENGTLPKPLIVMRLNDGLSVIDGNHRTAALCYCQATADDILKNGGVAPMKSHQIWLGAHAKGEVPN
jgi:hypothetical protein